MDKTERDAEMFFVLEERDQLLKAARASIENLGLSDYLAAVAEADDCGRWRVYTEHIIKTERIPDGHATKPMIDALVIMLNNIKFRYDDWGADLILRMPYKAHRKLMLASSRDNLMWGYASPDRGEIYGATVEKTDKLSGNIEIVALFDGKEAKKPVGIITEAEWSAMPTWSATPMFWVK